MNVALIGYGKMGREIEQVLLERGHTVMLTIDVDNAGDLCPDRIEGVDVAIEFSSPAAAYENVCKCLACGLPVVCGTTAWLDRYDEAVDLCRRQGGTFFYASNYSIGVNIFFKVNRELARLMNPFPQYDVSLEEVHHTMKKDAPSGTAITLAEGILAEMDRKQRWVCGTTVEPSELEIGAIRRSVVPGIHTVTWESDVDRITISHDAKSRRGFAVGAVLAAEFIVGRTGVFTMDDLMNS